MDLEAHERDERRKQLAERLLTTTGSHFFEIPILEVLKQSGKLPSHKVIKQVGSRITLKADDLKQLGGNGEVRWRNSVKMARRSLIRQGYLRSDSPYGIWEITDAGRERLAAEMPF
jgi:restriction system protein